MQESQTGYMVDFAGWLKQYVASQPTVFDPSVPFLSNPDNVGALIGISVLTVMCIGSGILIAIENSDCDGGPSLFFWSLGIIGIIAIFALGTAKGAFVPNPNAKPAPTAFATVMEKVYGVERLVSENGKPVEYGDTNVEFVDSNGDFVKGLIIYEDGNYNTSMSQYDPSHGKLGLAIQASDETITDSPKYRMVKPVNKAKGVKVNLTSSNKNDSRVADTATKE